MKDDMKDKTLEERLAAMAEEEGLPEWMKETAQEAQDALDQAEPTDFEALQDELKAMAQGGASWPEQLDYVNGELVRLLGNPATRHLRAVGQ